MSKRGADDYITKEHGSTPNKQEDSKVKMATAAQLAKRKIAAPKSRLNRSNAASPAPPANPFGGSTFGSAQPSSQQTFGNVGGGLTFGQSQSFPPGGSASGGDFNFSVPSQSTSFTFGQPVQNNPFAALNGGPPQDENKPPEDTLMESPQKKPAFGGGTFGSTQGAGNKGALFGGFTAFGQSSGNQQPPTSQPAVSFGQPQANGFGTSLFGKQPDQAAGTTSSEPATSSPNPFGQSSKAAPITPSSSTANGLFGQSTQQKMPAFNFGQSSAEPAKNPFSLGQTPSQSALANETPKTPAFSFGQTSQPEVKSDTPKFSFGQPATPQPAATAPNAGTIFGQNLSETTTNSFTGFGSPKPSETPAKPATERATDATVSSAAPTGAGTASASHPFASLFSQTSKESSPSPDLEIPKPVFSFAAPSQPKDAFSPSKNSDSQPLEQPSKDVSTPSLFGLNPAGAPPASSLFAKPSSETKPSTPLFGTPNVNRTDEPVGKTPTTNFSFGQPSTAKPAVTADPVISKPFTFGTPTSTTNQSTTGTPSTALKRPAPEPVQSKADATQGKSKDSAGEERVTEPASSSVGMSSTTTSANDLAASNEDPKRTIYTNPPARIPPYLNAEKYKSYDSNYRLHSLNREFRKRVACLDPTTEDFENIVRTYVAARESIGESIGLYARNIAGTKRKEDRMDDDDDRSDTAKKIRTESGAAVQNTPSKPQFGSGSIFQPVPSTAQSTPGKGVNASSTNSENPGPSSASSLFKSMIPASSVATPPVSKVTSDSLAASNAQSTTKPATGFQFGAAGTPATQLPKPASSKTTTPPTSPPKKAGFQVSGFSAPATTNFMNAFKKQSEANTAKFEKEAMEKRKAEDFDSDEEDEEEWTRKYQEEQRAKRAKLDAFRGFTPSFENSDASDDNAQPKMFGQTSKQAVNISSDEGASEDEEGQDDAEDPEAEAGDDENEDDGDDEDDEVLRSQPLVTNGKTIFDRISRGSETKPDDTPKPAQTVAASSVFGQSLKATPETPSFSPITPSSNAGYKPSTTFSFTPTPRDSPTPTAGASVFDGGFTRDGPIPGEGLFGSRSNTPVNGEKSSSSLFGSLGASQSTPGEDHTWKKGSAIKFGSDTQAPAVNITAPSPVKETPKFGSLFGTSNAPATGTSSSNSLGFGFGTSTSAPVPGFLGAASHLAPGSGTTSGFSSRATSPGATDNESVATNETEDAQNDPQSALLAHSGPYPGEENEDIIFEARARILRNYREEEIEGTKKIKGWNVEGLGPMRVLKHKQSGKTRIVARAEPNANVVFNANLTAGIDYKATNNTVVMPEFGEAGPPTQWMVKVKTPSIATELATVLEENKNP